MNFVEVVVESDGDRLHLTGPDGGFEFDLSAAYVGRHEDGLDASSYTLGIRPENVSVTDSGAADSITAAIDVVEPVGSDNFLHLDVSSEFIARVGSDVDLEPGDRVTLTFDESDVHLFDPETGRNVFTRERDAPTVTS